MPYNATTPTKNKREILQHFERPFAGNKETDLFVENRILKNCRYFFCSNREDKQKATCSHCQKKIVIAEHLKHNDKTLCPECGVKGQVFHTWRKSVRRIWDAAYFHYFAKSKIDAQSITCKGMVVVRKYDDNFKPINIYNSRAFYVFEASGKNYSLLADYYYRIEYPRPKPLFQWPKTMFTRDPIIASGWIKVWAVNIESLNAAIKETKFQYMDRSMVINESYGYVQLLTLYNRYPCIEYLMKFKLHNIVDAILEKCNYQNAIDLKGKNAGEVFRISLSKEEIDFFRNAGSGEVLAALRLKQILKKRGHDFNPQDFKEIANTYSGQGYKQMLEIFKYALPKTLNEYLKKQAEKYDTYDHRWKQPAYYAVNDYYDYLSDCRNLNLDLSDKSILYPKNLKTAHQRTTKMVKYQADEKLNKAIADTIEKRKEMKYENKVYLIRPAASTEELIKEGQTLHHCVGGYAKRYANGETNILFLRKKEDPDNPYFTLEVKKVSGKFAVVQIRGKNNCDPPKEIMRFYHNYEKKLQTLGGKKNVRINNRKNA